MQRNDYENNIVYSVCSIFSKLDRLRADTAKFKGMQRRIIACGDDFGNHLCRVDVFKPNYKVGIPSGAYCELEII